MSDNKAHHGHGDHSKTYWLVFIALIIGTAIGALAGYFGGPMDAFMMRLTDAFLCFPQLFVLIVLVVAACEVVVGLGLVVAMYRRRLPLDVDEMKELKG